MLNIVSNAAQALHGTTAGPRIRLTTRVARGVTLAKKRHRLALASRSRTTGRACRPTIRDKIFYPLVSGREGGSGLGLTIAQTFVAQHDGTIECDERARPHGVHDPAAAGNDARSRRMNTGMNETMYAYDYEPPRGDGMKAVWIVDDDRSIRWVLEKALAREGIPFKTFASAYEVLQALAVSQPQVLVSDIRMPGESGLALLNKIKERYPQIPVIIMTAYSDLDSAVAAFQGGAFEYLPKPFDVDHALALIRRATTETPAIAPAARAAARRRRRSSARRRRCRKCSARSAGCRNRTRRC